MAHSDPPAPGELAWRVAQRCDGGACVRVASASEMIAMGDSKNPAGPVLSFTRSEWEAFVTGVKRGEFDGF